MSLGHALPAITFVSFVCNKYGLPNSNRCYSETRKQADGHLKWFDMCCPVGCVFKNCKCLPAGIVGPNYNRQSITRCTQGIRPLRSNKPIIPYPGHVHFGRTGSTVHNLGRHSYHLGNQRKAAYHQRSNVVHVNDPLPRTFLPSRTVGYKDSHRLNVRKRRPTLRNPTGMYHHSNRILHEGSFYDPTLSRDGFKSVYKNPKYTLPEKTYRKQESRFGQYGDNVNNNNYLKFNENLKRDNRHTTDHLNTEAYLQTTNGGNYQDTTGFDTDHSIRMRKYGDVYGKKRPTAHTHTHSHGPLTHTHLHTHDREHQHHVTETGTYTDPGYTETGSETAAARKETVEVIDTWGLGRSGTNNKQIGGNSFDGINTGNGKNADVKVIYNNDGLITSAIIEDRSTGPKNTLIDRTAGQTSQGITGGGTFIDRTSETRGNVGVIDSTSSGVGGWNTQTGTTTNIGGNVGKVEVGSTINQGIGGGNTLVDMTSDTGRNWWENEGKKIDTSSSGVGGGNTQIGSETNTVGNVATIDGTITGGQTFETGNTVIDTRGSLINIGDNTHVDTLNRNTGNSGSSGTKVTSSSSGNSKVVVNQSHTRITKTETTAHGNTNTDTSIGSTTSHAQTVHIGGPEHSSIDRSGGSRHQNIITDKSQQTTSIGGFSTKDMEANKANIRDQTAIFQSSGATGTTSTDTSSTNQHVKVIKAVDNSLINSGSSISSGSSTRVVDNNSGGIVRNVNVGSTGGAIVDNAVDNRGQSSIVDDTFPVIGGGRTAEQRREEVILQDDTYLSPDICIECEIDDGGIGYIYHPEHCDMFVMCIPTIDGKMTPVSQQCPHGQFWDQSSLTCRPSHLTVCPMDICFKRKSEMQGRTYGHRSNCRSYWECSNGHSLERCCPKGQSYNSLRGGCVPDRTCDTLCGQEMELPTKPVDKCTRRSVRGHPRKYEWDTQNGWVTMNCPPGTIFKDDVCDCIYFGNPITGTQSPAYDPQEQDVCTPEVHLTFDDFMDHSGKNSYVYNSNVTLDGFGAGCFTGNSAISLPMFTNMHLGQKLFAKIRYKQPYTSENQALLYNGDCVKRPSLIVTSSTRSNTVKATSSYKETTQMDLASSVPADEWRHVIINIDGKRLIGKTGQDRKQVIIDGGIARTQCGLKIGWGKNYPGFVGCIDDFVLYRCFPGKI